MNWLRILVRRCSLRAQLQWLLICEAALSAPSEYYHGDNSEEIAEVQTRQSQLRAQLQLLSGEA